VIQIIAVITSVSFAFVGSLVLLKIVNRLVGLRVSGEDESMGLDLSEHNESAYALELV
jgi:Amt family ammonium transporter